MAKQLPDPNRPLQRRFWLVERIGWSILTLIIVWAIAGGAGGGMLADAQLHGEGVELHYERFARHGAGTQIEFRWHAAPRGELSLALDATFVDRMEIDFISHGLQPVRSADAVVFRLVDPPRSGSLLLKAHPQKVGSVATQVQVNGAPLGHIRIFVFP